MNIDELSHYGEQFNIFVKFVFFVDGGGFL